MNTLARDLHEHTCTSALTRALLHEKACKSILASDNLHEHTCTEHLRLRRATCTKNLRSATCPEHSVQSTCTEHLHRALAQCNFHRRRAQSNFQRTLPRANSREETSASTLAQSNLREKLRFKFLLDSISLAKAKTAFDIILTPPTLHILLSGHPFYCLQRLHFLARGCLPIKYIILVAVGNCSGGCNRLRVLLTHCRFKHHRLGSTLEVAFSGALFKVATRGFWTVVYLHKGLAGK